MILNFKGGCIASGRVTSKGAELTYVGAKGTPKYAFSLMVRNERDEAGEWHSEYLNCELFGKNAESAPEINAGDLVLCCGKLERRNYTARSGEQKQAVELKCDFAIAAPSGGLDYGGSPVKGGVDVYADGEEYGTDEGGELPF